MPVNCTHTPQSISVRPLLLALVITGGFMVLEFVGGILSGSLALLSDAGHMLTDTAALGLSLWPANLLTRSGPTDTTE